jgi:hypothetical protein
MIICCTGGGCVFGRGASRGWSLDTGCEAHYHYERLHQALGYRPPRQVFEEALQVATLRRRRKTAGANHELVAQ